MILYVDIQSKRIVSSPRLNRDLTRIDVKRGDVLPCSIIFIENGKSLGLPSGNLVTFCAKQKGGYEGPAMVFSENFTHVVEDDIHKYNGIIDLRGAELQEALDRGNTALDDLASIDLHAEVSWFDTGEVNVYTSLTTTLRVYNDVYKGNESNPEIPIGEPLAFPYGIKTNLIESIDGGVIQVVGTLAASHIHGNIAGNLYTHVRAGENLFKGDPVYVSGSHGSGASLIPIVSRADASNPAKMPAIGLMDADLVANSNGHMVIAGAITEINTESYAINQTLFVGIGGGITNVQPISNLQVIGRVERANANNGAIIVSPLASTFVSWDNVTGKPSSFPNADVANAASGIVSNVLVKRSASGEAGFTSIYLERNGDVLTFTPFQIAAESFNCTIDFETGQILNGTTEIIGWKDGAVDVGAAVRWKRGSFAQSLNGAASLSGNRTVTLPDASGTLILDTDSRLSDARTPLAHTHGNITNDGRIGTTSNLVVVTTAGGAVTTQSRSGIDSRTSFPNADVTNAASNAAASTLVRRDVSGNAAFAFLTCTTLNSSGDVQFLGNLVFSGIFSTTFVEAATANRTITVPDASGTMALASTQAQTFLNALPASIPSAILNLDSSTQALKLPSMTETQRNAITSPVAGLLLYNTTTNRPNFHNGSAWVSL